MNLYTNKVKFNHILSAFQKKFGKFNQVVLWNCAETLSKVIQKNLKILHELEDYDFFLKTRWKMMLHRNFLPLLDYILALKRSSCLFSLFQQLKLKQKSVELTN